MNLTRRHPSVLAASALAVLAIAAPAAQAKSAKLAGQLIAAATTKGSKVEAPILLTEKSAKKLKLRSPLATLKTKAKATLPAPNPMGAGTVEIAAGTLRAGDELAGKGKVKGKKKALMPKLKGKKLEVTARESKFSVDELTNSLVALYQQVGLLGLRVDALETGLADLRAQVEALAAQNSSLETQVANLLAQMTDLEATLDALTSALPTPAQLQQALADIADLQSGLAALEALVGTLPTDTDITDLQGQINSISSDLSTLETTVGDLGDDIVTICDNALILPGLAGLCTP